MSRQFFNLVFDTGMQDVIETAEADEWFHDVAQRTALFDLDAPFRRGFSGLLPTNLKGFHLPPGSLTGAVARSACWKDRRAARRAKRYRVRTGALRSSTRRCRSPKR